MHMQNKTTCRKSTEKDLLKLSAAKYNISYLLCVREHVLFQVLFPDECSLTEVTLQLLCTSVDEHM